MQTEEASAARMGSQRLTLTFLVTVLCVILVGGFRIVSAINPALPGQAVGALLNALRLSLFASTRGVFSLIDIVLLALFWGDALRRHFRPGKLAAVEAQEQIGGERATADNLVGEQLAGDLLAGAIVSIVLAIFFRRETLSLLFGGRPLTTCDVSWFIGTCTPPGGGVNNPPTLFFLNLVLVPLFYLVVGLLILLIAATVRAWRRGEEEIALATLITLRAAISRRFAIGNLLRSFRIFWPVCLFVAVVLAALTAHFIQLYLYGVVGLQASNPHPSVLLVDLNPRNYLWEAAACASGAIIVIAFVLSISLQIFPQRVDSLSFWREAVFSRRQLRRIGLIVTQIYWMFALILTLLNALLLAAHFSVGAPFPQPDPLTIASFVVFVALAMRWIDGRRRISTRIKRDVTQAGLSDVTIPDVAAVIPGDTIFPEAEAAPTEERIAAPTSAEDATKSQATH